MTSLFGYEMFVLFFLLFLSDSLTVPLLCTLNHELKIFQLQLKTIECLLKLVSLGVQEVLFFR